MAVKPSQSQLITNLDGDVINGNRNSNYQRNNFKPLNLIGIWLPMCTVDPNTARSDDYSYQSPTGPPPPTPLSTRSIYSLHSRQKFPRKYYIWRIFDVLAWGMRRNLSRLSILLRRVGMATVYHCHQPKEKRKMTRWHLPQTIPK